MSDEYWGMAFKHATTIHNVSPTQALGGEAPFTILCGRPFDVNQLKVFGAKAYVHVPKASRHKLGKRARTGIYVGFDHESQSHQVWVPQTKQMVNTIHVKFNEVQTNDITQSLEAARETRRYTELTPTVSEENALHAASDKQSRICASAAGENATNTSSAQTPHDGDAPDVDTALQSDEKEQWLAAITEEASALEANHVYEVVRADQIPKGAKLLPSKFVLKRKRDQNGTVQRYKARLVAKGYSQKHGIDYQETFAPTTSKTALRTMLAMSAVEGMYMLQLDIVTAFLYAEIDMDHVYVKPPHIMGLFNRDEVLHLRKALYGLKQAPRLWNTKLDRWLKDSGFTQAKSEQCIYKRVHMIKTTKCGWRST
ncbi:hypothetical protein PTSG_13039 [Salpingoeca rosetta]|uniref:Uncharacterized protein n=1 Tax=Salpingoeca rosetta (strain ATCC 50818 / BSB-021) TaxID=946362 RepID=F2UPK6_SALR5|nr:uncharacterized protein PTSG_13039 [Salpingoeca rosetta]EGD79561.1 hypothetical protein PTSG_13039 [Salpingoeca rosetta]|eukprot:XP_004988789.1 hypothetical protein PTSG_13039 [Salpingoeca rosetta]